MPASYPESVKQWTDKQDHVDDVFSGDINGAYDEIKAIETELMQIGYKRSVRVATTQNGSLATAFANGQTVDGVALVTGDRILIKDQTNGAENGIYTVNASGAPTRAIDANSNAHMVAGLMVYVREGTENAKGTWKLTTNGAITLGTTPLAFENEVKAHVAEMAKFENIEANGQYVGEVTTEAVASTGSLYDLLYLSPSGYNKAQANADTALPCLAMRVEVGTGNRKLLKNGYVRNDSWAFTKGQLLYVSPATAGLITTTKPTTAGQRIQIVGYAVASNIIYFNPDYTWIEI